MKNVTAAQSEVAVVTPPVKKATTKKAVIAAPTTTTPPAKKAATKKAATAVETNSTTPVKKAAAKKAPVKKAAPAPAAPTAKKPWSVNGKTGYHQKLRGFADGDTVETIVKGKKVKATFRYFKISPVRYPEGRIFVEYKGKMLKRVKAAVTKVPAVA